ncbi:MAG: PIG-L family deacetylase, partial [Dehalococcoidia bacterium]|nr:PIG-L family deacetylase [Dehalococcoidia bacterium]
MWPEPTAGRIRIRGKSLIGERMAAGLEDLFGHERPCEPDKAAGEFRRALVVAAHPDDADFGAAGVAALLAQAGWEVRYLVVTDGSKGSDDPAITQPELVAMRAEEQRAAAAILGVRDVRFLGHTDGELVWSHALIGEIVREIREFRPYSVYTHDPEAVIIGNSFVSHSDHRATGLATVDAVYPAARDRLNFPEQIAAGLQPHKVRE